jgi:hypothetical protein
MGRSPPRGGALEFDRAMPAVGRGCPSNDPERCARAAVLHANWAGPLCAYNDDSHPTVSN